MNQIKTAEEIQKLWDDYKFSICTINEQLELIDEESFKDALAAFSAHFANEWVKLTSTEALKLNHEDTSLTILQFDNGEMCFYNDDNWPRAIVVGYFELPQPPTL